MHAPRRTLGRGSAVVLSPDGRYLAWISDARGDLEVAVGDARTGETLGTWTGTEARWCPDGTSLLVGDG